MTRFARPITGVVLVLVALVFGLVIGNRSVQAADAPLPKPGITVSPGELNFVLSKDAPNQSIPVTITNEYESVIILGAEFKGIDENAGLLVPTDNLDKTFADGLHISETSILIPPHQSKVVRVQADNSETLSPGGHYATLVLTQQDIGGKQVSLKASVSLSLFVVKVAGARQHLTVSTFSTNGWLFRLPSKATLSFRNDGNVHAVPRANISVLDTSYTVLAKGIANQQSLPLLPGNSLTSEVSITGLATTWKPQRLLVWAAYRSDGSDDQQIIRRSVWYIPPVYPVLLVALGMVAWFTRGRWLPRARVLPARIRAALSTATSTAKATDTSTTADLEPPVISEVAPLAASPSPRRKRPAKSMKPSAKRGAKAKNAAAKSSSKVAKIIAVTDPEPEKPLLTLASLQQRTTRVAPKSKAKPKATKQTAQKPKNSQKKATKASTTSKKPKSAD